MAGKKNKCTRCGGDFLSISEMDRRWKRRKKEQHTQKDNTSTCIRCFDVQRLKNNYETEKKKIKLNDKKNARKRLHSNEDNVHLYKNCKLRYFWSLEYKLYTKYIYLYIWLLFINIGPEKLSLRKTGSYKRNI